MTVLLTLDLPCLAYVSSPWLDNTDISCPEPPPGSDFLSFLNLCSRLLESSGKMGQVDQNWGTEYEHFYFGRLKNYKITHLPPHFNMCKSMSRVQLKIYQFFKTSMLDSTTHSSRGFTRHFFYWDVWVMSESNLICLSQIWVKKETEKSMYLRHIPLFLIKWTLLAIDSDCLPKVCYLKLKKKTQISEQTQIIWHAVLPILSMGCKRPPWRVKKQAIRSSWHHYCQGKEQIDILHSLSITSYLLAWTW